MNRRKILITGGAIAVVGTGAALVQRRAIGSMDEYSEAQAQLRAKLAANPSTSEMIRYATLAPNGHNTQPWRFAASETGITILPDLTRRTPVVDPDDHHIYVSLGCAAENLDLAAHHAGKGGTLEFDAAGDGQLIYTFGNGGERDAQLFAAIPQRQCTRAAYDGRTASAAQIERLTKSAETDGVSLTLLTDDTAMSAAKDLIVAGNDLQMADPGFVSELKHWLRFNPRAALDAGDGLFSASTGNPALPSWLGPRVFDMAFKKDAETDKLTKQMQSSAGIAIFTGASEDRAGWIAVGRSCQRFLLTATALGMKTAFLNQPAEVGSLRSDLAALAGMPGKRPDLLIRFGFGEDLPFSYRRPVTEVMV